MVDEVRGGDTLSPAVRDCSLTRGDVPEVLKRRYYTDERGGEGLGFYVDARVQSAAFRDRGRDLITTRADPNAIRDMMAIAQHRKWAIVAVRGSVDFRREAWLVGRTIGLEVQGYRASERDLQELERRQVRTREREDQRDLRQDRAKAYRSPAEGERQMRIVETVVNSRVADHQRRSQIVAAARERIAVWLEKGARFDEVHQKRERPPERHRAR